MPGEKILIVDDDSQITTLIEFILKKEGYLTVVAHSGQEGIKLISQENPDLMILDLMMPEMDGYQVCSVIKSDEQTRNLPILMLTALGSGKDFEKGLESGANWYITKPFESQHLLKRVRYLINLSKKGS